MAEGGIQVYSLRNTQRLRGKAQITEPIKALYPAIVNGAAQAVVNKGLEAFTMSMRMVPIDTGRLARSGRLMLGGRTIARGTASYHTPGGPGTRRTGVDYLFQLRPGALKAVRGVVSKGSINVRIGFRRRDDDDQDITALIHEYGPYGDSHVQAKRGRSGKFITFPLSNIASTLPGEISDHVLLNIVEAIQKYNPGGFKP